MDSIPSRLVIRAPNWLGDAVMALPALAAVRAALPESQIAIAAIAGVAPMFEEETPAVPDEVLTIRDRGREMELLAAGKFDAALLLTNSFRSAWTARRAGIPERWGFGGNLRGGLLTRAVARPRNHVHQSAYYAALVRGLGFDVADRDPGHVDSRGYGAPRRRHPREVWRDGGDTAGWLRPGRSLWARKALASAARCAGDYACVDGAARGLRAGRRRERP